ncbi:ankyrin repeat domain-containing protein [Streptomyces hirsutus]|uniref:ankyrin repeat domain-containing protein n=1 Tax=Streptomyces hirsutus TaxID=35620 RepID=UPI0036CC6875
MEWDGLTDREHFGDWYRQERDRFADRARDADWDGLFEELGRQPGWVNLPRPGKRSGFAPLHQAAWHGADFAVVSRLIAHGAWRTQRTRDGRRAVDLARERGHTHLLQLLEPVVVRHLPSPADALEHHFHALLRESTGRCFEQIEHLLPPLSPLTEGPSVEIVFKVVGMMGGFTYRLEEDVVHVHGHSRMDADSGQYYRVTPEGWSRI